MIATKPSISRFDLRRVHRSGWLNLVVRRVKAGPSVGRDVKSFRTLSSRRQ